MRAARAPSSSSPTRASRRWRSPTRPDVDSAGVGLGSAARQGPGRALADGQIAVCHLEGDRVTAAAAVTRALRIKAARLEPLGGVLVAEAGVAPGRRGRLRIAASIG